MSVTQALVIGLRVRYVDTLYFGTITAVDVNRVGSAWYFVTWDDQSLAKTLWFPADELVKCGP